MDIPQTSHLEELAHFTSENTVFESCTQKCVSVANDITREDIFLKNRWQLFYSDHPKVLLNDFITHFFC